MALYCVTVVSAGGLFMYGVHEKRLAEQRPDKSWTAMFWEREKQNLVRWNTKAFVELPSARKEELIIWLDSRWRAESLNNQRYNNQEKRMLDFAIGAILNDVVNRERYAKYKDLSNDDQSGFMSKLGKDEALLFREWINLELQRINGKK